MTKRRKPAKKAAKPRLKFKIPKAKNNAKSFEFSHQPKSPEKVIEFLEGQTFNQFNYLLRKNKPDGVHYKPPLFVVVVIGILQPGKRGKKKVKYYSQKSQNIAMTRPNIKQFAVDTVKKLRDEYDTYHGGMSEENDDFDEDDDTSGRREYTEDLDPTKIVSVTVRYYYGVNAPDNGRLSDDIEPEGIQLV